MNTSHIIQIDLEQIFALSDINWLFKFIYLHDYWLFGFAFALLPLLAIKKLKKYHFIFLTTWAVILASIMFVSMNIESQFLNENQIKLIKSVDNQSFQSFIQETTQRDGATFKMIHDVFSPLTGKKNKMESIEFYKKVKP